MHSLGFQHGRAHWSHMPGPTCRVDLPSHQQPTFPLPHRQTKQAENAGKSATQKKAEQKAAKASKNEKKSFG